MSKIIGLVPFKNEEWILGYTLSCLSVFCDEIIVLDDGSDDDSVEVCKSFDKVVDVIRKRPRPSKYRNEPRDWNLLTKAGLQRGADWLFYTDADEMLSMNILDFLRELPSLNDVGVVQFRKVALWRSKSLYRCETEKWVVSPSHVLNPILIRSTDKLYWPNPKGNFMKRLIKFLVRGERFIPIYGRVFPKGVVGRRLLVNDIVAVHFNNLSYRNLIRKQLVYALNQQLERPYLGVEKIVSWAYSRLDETKLKVEPVEEGWIWSDYEHLIKRECD